MYNQTVISTIELANPLPDLLMEQSGMIKEDSMLWIHSDSGNDSKLFAIELDAYTLDQEIEFSNIPNADWEDICADDEYVYIGDFGNNAGNRTDLKVYKMSKSELFGSNPASIVPEVISFSYPEQTDFSEQFNSHNFDCEAMVVIENELFLFTKEWISTSTSIYKLPTTEGQHEAEFLGNISCDGLITGADYDAQLNAICLTGYDLNFGLAPFLFLLWDYTDLDFTSGNKRRLDLDWPSHQVESIAYNNEGKWLIGNEYFSIGPIAFTHQLREVDILSYYTSTVSLEELVHEEFFLFPNPAKEGIHIPENILSISVFSQSGQLILETFDNPKWIDLDPGIYFLHLRTNDRLFTQKAVVLN